MELYNITPDGFSNLQANLKEAKGDWDFSDFVNVRKDMMINESVATIYIQGATLNKAPEIYKALGNTDYQDVIADLDQALEAGAKGVILEIDSCGGTVQGCKELADKVANYPLPVVTYYNGMGCSAAYKTGCGGDVIIATPTSIVGNIGTILCFTDTSKMYESYGINVEAITNDGATLKDTFHRLPLTDDQRDFLTDGINSNGEAFQNHVKANRPTIDDEVWKAGWYSGERAIELGLIDMTGDYDSALETINELINELTTN